MIDHAFKSVGRVADSEFVPAVCRIVYLRPNMYSEEQITVGIVIANQSGSVFRTIVNSEVARSTLRSFFSEEVEEQALEDLNLLEQKVKQASSLSFVESPSGLLRLGPISEVSCSDPLRFAQDLLEVSSSLFRTYHCATRTSDSVGQDVIASQLYDSVTQLNVIKATGLFRGAEVRVSDGFSIKLPICGERIFGSPVSLVTPKVATAKTQAAALIAKYSVARKILHRRPAIYVLAPSRAQRGINHELVENSLIELSAIASELNVLLRHERNLSELAYALLKDEAA